MSNQANIYQEVNKCCKKSLTANKRNKDLVIQDLECESIVPDSANSCSSEIVSYPVSKDFPF